MEMRNKKILLLTLVHPDFLPPVYSTGQVLRDLGFDIHILTFDSFETCNYKLKREKRFIYRDFRFDHSYNHKIILV